MSLHDTHNDFVTATSGLAVRRQQIIPSAHLDTLRHERTASANTRANEFHRVASVPVAVVEKWLAEGFDVYREPAKAILAKLRSEDLGAFIATSKRV